MTFIEYLHRHHEITESAIGMLHLQLMDGDQAAALRTIERALSQLTDIHSKRNDALAEERGIDREALRQLTGC